MVDKTVNYKVSIGLWKSLKNLVIVVGIPALILFVDNWTQILPEEWSSYAAPLMGFLAYFVKNFVEIKYLKKN